MRTGKASKTAMGVAFLRALGNLSPVVPGFSDAMAEKFLPERWVYWVKLARIRVMRGQVRSPYPFWAEGMGIFNQFRTRILDDALRAALPFEQLVILGAGLDGRAWRLDELEKTEVFEVDHPDTQAWKEPRAAGLSPKARKVHFVPVDFAKDNLSFCLKQAGFDSDRRTFWLWEGVVMYLSAEEIGKTFALMKSLSLPESRVALTYMSKKNGKTIKSLAVAAIGEPLRSGFAPPELRDLAAKDGWETTADTGIEDWKSALTPELELTEKKVGPEWYERIWQGRVGSR